MILLSAISVVSRRLLSPATTRVSTGSASGSAFWMMGGRMLGGRLRSAPATFSLTSWAALSISRSRTNWQTTRALPSVAMDVISSSPLMVDNASSRGSTTWVVISSGVAPGSRTLTLTVAGSARGKRSTPSSRNEKTPSTTRKVMSITAKTPRLTQSSARVMAGPYSAAVTRAPSRRSSPSSGTATSSPSLSPSTISASSPSLLPSFTSVSRSFFASTAYTL